MYLSFFPQTSRAGNGDVPVQQDLDSEDVVLSETISKTTSAADASGSDKEAIHSELDDAFASFRRLRNNFLVNFRNFEDLFHDRQRELAKLASKSGKDESEVILRNLDKQELACSNIVKKMKQDLDKLGEISKEKSKVQWSSWKASQRRRDIIKADRIIAQCKEKVNWIDLFSLHVLFSQCWLVM